MEEEVVTEKDEDGKTITLVTGVNKIFDPVLLEEIIQYNNTDNFDRIVAAELAIAQAIKMDPIMGKIGGESDARIASLFNKRSKLQLFTETKGMFIHKKQKLFS